MSSSAEPRTVREALPEPGQLVRVRSRAWLVEEIVPPARPSEQTLVRLSCLDDDAQGEELAVLWEREVDAAVVFMGYGRLRDQIAAAARDRPRDIHLLPAVAPDDLLDWTAGADVAFVGQPPREDSIQHAALGSSVTSTGAPFGFFSGELEDVRLWSYARSASQISSAVIPSTAVTIVGRWPDFAHSSA